MIICLLCPLLCGLFFFWKGAKGELFYKAKNDFLEQRINPSNRRERCLYLTPKGNEACNQHISFDRKKTSEFIIYLSQYCTPEEIDGFFKVLKYRTEFFENAVNRDKNDFKDQ